MWLAPPFAPTIGLLTAGVAADLVLGDPEYAWHPVRLIGGMLTKTEDWLRAAGFDGYGGGILLFIMLTAVSLAVTGAGVALAARLSAAAGWLLHAALVYSLLALGDLLRHVRSIDRAVGADNLELARKRVAGLVGRDTERMDAAACRRAAVESLSENLTDGFVSPVFWYVLLGLPGLVTFKVVSTMDSMVGYKTPRYLRFGWCGARLDDLMNYIPARLTWLTLGAVAAFIPECSARKAWSVGWRQHQLLLGPNAGWSEAAAAGAIQRRIVGPIWRDRVRVTDLWIGDPADPPLETHRDVKRAERLAVVAAMVVVTIGCLVLLWV